MEVKTIIREIQELPLGKRFFIVEQTLKSIKKEELEHQKKQIRKIFTKNIPIIEVSKTFL